MSQNKSKKNKKLIQNKTISKQNPLKEILNTVPEENREEFLEGYRQLIVAKVSETSIHQGPLPDPATLEAYKEIYADAPKYIFEIYRDTGKTEIELIKKIQEDNTKTIRYGQWFGFILTIILIVTGGVITVKGHNTTGNVIFGTTIIGLAGIFIKSTAKKKEDKKES
ncbi:MAG: hypothetical protein CR982_06775 [Candidatus Cloacimonadota bacterium]|nr:MAG: hypothetical protein CR982_06775 [Candidatus Cloacimonadota bacterium]PIE77813.1 MAG: hypothetical protein CSA15_10990 [Candidatus Delongbacteria bacterium]